MFDRRSLEAPYKEHNFISITHLLAIFEEDEGWHTRDLVLCRDLLTFVHINLEEHHVGQALAQSLQYKHTSLANHNYDVICIHQKVGR